MFVDSYAEERASIQKCLHVETYWNVAFKGLVKSIYLSKDFCKFYFSRSVYDLNIRKQMDCPSCFDLYDEEERCPRNLPCGHTYCELCLDKILALTGKLECPVCRIKLPPKIVPSQLSKNYIAASLALKQRELQKKLLFCQLHREPMKLFCENCQENICPSCIIDHSGHSFIKQEHSGIYLECNE